MARRVERIGIDQHRDDRLTDSTFRLLCEVVVAYEGLFPASVVTPPGAISWPSL